MRAQAVATCTSLLQEWRSNAGRYAANLTCVQMHDQAHTQARPESLQDR